MWHETFSVTSITEALQILAYKRESGRIVAGGTDLILEIERGVRKGIEALIDVTRIPGLDRITLDEDGTVHLGPLVTHNHCAASKIIREHAFPLAQAALEVGAPQIRNRGTVAGNLITASPANDTITPLMALGARVTLASTHGERVVPLSQFYTGVRRTVMEPDEMLVDISFPGLRADQHGSFIKLGLRRAQAISVVNAAVILTLDGAKIRKACITLGAVTPVIVHARKAEVYLAGRELTEEVIAHAVDLAQEAAHPINDVRSSAAYRDEMVRVCVSRSLKAIARGEERALFPDNPVMLSTQSEQGEHPHLDKSIYHMHQTPIETTINGKPFVFNTGQNKTLLRLLREEAGLIGTKEGCSEGECGACTIFLDGMAVMSCLVPAVRAHGAQIVTIEGLADEEKLHPVQEAFIEAGAVQCGYCTPGFLMSAAKLLEENPHPSHEQVQQAITGNLCRCTGYYKIVEAIERAAELEGSHVRQVSEV